MGCIIQNLDNKESVYLTNKQAKEMLSDKVKEILMIRN